MAVEQIILTGEEVQHFLTPAEMQEAIISLSRGLATARLQLDELQHSVFLTSIPDGVRRHRIRTIDIRIIRDEERLDLLNQAITNPSICITREQIGMNNGKDNDDKIDPRANKSNIIAHKSDRKPFWRFW